MQRRTNPLSNYPPHIWDQLPQITLTRRALLEYDRRTRYNANSLWTALLKKVNHQHFSSLDSSALLPPDTTHLKNLASGGFIGFNVLRGYAKVHADMLRSVEVDIGRDDSSDACTDYSAVHVQLLIGIGVFPLNALKNGPRPGNLASMRQILASPRPQTSIPEAKLMEFEEAVELGDPEATKLLASILMEDEIGLVHAGHGVTLSRLEKIHSYVKLPRPDVYYGAKAEQISDTVRRELDRYIVPSNDPDQPVAPNFFFEAGQADSKQATRRAVYYNAFGARAMFHLQNPGWSSAFSSSTPLMPLEYDGNIYTMTATLCGNVLSIYGTFPQQASAGNNLGRSMTTTAITSETETEYYTILLGMYAMFGGEERVLEGVNAYRNARDWAAEQRNRLLAAANEIGDGMGAARKAS